MQSRFLLPATLFGLMLAAGGLSTAFGGEVPSKSKDKAGEAQAGATSQQGWSRVENKRVCMVTNAVFPRDQIPVEVGGKTYYGCCQNCKATLANDESVRFAVDPVSQKKVDKATAVIAGSVDGSVLYFENEGTFQKFLASGAKPPL